MTSLTSLSRQDTLPASDPIWTKSESCVPGLPMPIPPRNEPSLSFYIVPIGDDIDGHSLTRVTTTRSTPRSLPQTLHLQVAEADKDVPTSVTPESVSNLCGTSNFRIPTYVLRSSSWLDYLIRIPFLLATLFGRNHQLRVSPHIWPLVHFHRLSRRLIQMYQFPFKLHLNQAFR